MPFENSVGESQRDSGLKPRVARNELPWVRRHEDFNPNGVAFAPQSRNPVGVERNFDPLTQGSSFLATLGWQTQSLWDWVLQLNGAANP